MVIKVDLEEGVKVVAVEIVAVLVAALFQITVVIVVVVTAAVEAVAVVVEIVFHVVLVAVIALLLVAAVVIFVILEVEPSSSNITCHCNEEIIHMKHVQIMNFIHLHKSLAHAFKEILGKWIFFVS